jgi:molybdenum cofactor cytidylyltransferase
MGRTKANLPLGPRDTFLTRIVRTAYEAHVTDVVVVVGHDAQAVRESAAAHGVLPRFVENPHYKTGQFSSVLAGLTAIDHPGITALMLTLVDVPLVSAGTIAAVLDRYGRSRPPIVRAVRGAEHGHPVVIDRSLFAELRVADPSAGLKPLVRQHASSSGDVEVDDDGAFLDIDTPLEYERVCRQLERVE